MLGISNFFSEKKRLFAFLAVILIVIAIPFTVFISKKQQVIRQRASGKQISLYFTNSGNCNTPLTSPINLSLNQPTPLSLCLSSTTDYDAGISGFNITLSASNSLTFQSANTTADADKFGSEPSPQRLNQNKAIRFTRILTSNNISDTPLRILDFAVLTAIAESGSITMPTAEIVSLTQDELLTVESPTLSYNSTLSPTIPPTSTPQPGAPTPTATTGGVTLRMSLNTQDAQLTEPTIPVNLILYNFTTKIEVTGTVFPATQSFTKIFIAGTQYSTAIPLTSLPPGKYYIFARKGNMIGQSVFTVSSSNNDITVPTTTLVWGDINIDNKVDTLDFNALKACYGKSTDAIPSCASSDFDNNHVINQIDYNTWLRGFATWKKQGEGL